MKEMESEERVLSAAFSSPTSDTCSFTFPFPALDVFSSLLYLQTHQRAFPSSFTCSDTNRRNHNHNLPTLSCSLNSLSCQEEQRGSWPRRQSLLCCSLGKAGKAPGNWSTLTACGVFRGTVQLKVLNNFFRHVQAVP